MDQVPLVTSMEDPVLQIGEKYLKPPILGTDGGTKSHEFLEKLQMAFDPPSYFREIIFQYFIKISV